MRLYSLTLAVVVAAVLFGGSAYAYPDKTITLVVPYDAGGAVDLLARVFAKHLSDKWGKTVIVENVTGASGQIGARRVARSNPDGYTLLVAAEAIMVVNPYVFPKLSYRPEDFVPISGIVGIEPALLAKKSLPVNNFAELLAYAKKRPGQLTFGSFGFATNGHLFILDLQRRSGLSFNIIQYKGVSGSLNDVVAGQVDLTFANANNARGPVEEGMVKVLAAAGEQRLEQFPNAATISETLPGYRALGWYGLWAPAGTPKEIIEKLNTEVRNMVASREFQEKYIKPNSWLPIASAPDQFRKFIDSERAKWGSVVRAANIHM